MMMNVNNQKDHINFRSLSVKIDVIFLIIVIITKNLYLGIRMQKVWSNDVKEMSMIDLEVYWWSYQKAMIINDEREEVERKEEKPRLGGKKGKELLE